ncbi:hypothetical protein Srubr_06860 [Streptomyces rubradiris]|uniref:Transposase n=1 Tax=Streptomyces rubradiris TaxID=285531 RepID=A0ABQ3R4P8_STRRR|nr:hypothetical protein GCM10018792_25920 [Streptomyces rubradiris]GHI50840.1 hypothetical protein Srubr_06860 [Streptomyces rubradiris]
MKIKQARAGVAPPAFCGVPRPHLGELIEELAPRWEARCASARHERRRGARRRQAGAGPKYELVLADRLLATLVHLRTVLTHEAPGVVYEEGSSTLGRATSEIRPLLAERGFATPDRSGPLLHILEDAFAYAAAENFTLRMTAPGPKSGAPGPTGSAGGPSSPASAGRTPPRPPRSVITRPAPCGPARCVPAGCTTRPVCAPRASPGSSACSPA